MMNKYMVLIAVVLCIFISACDESYKHDKTKISSKNIGRINIEIALCRNALNTDDCIDRLKERMVDE